MRSSQPDVEYNQNNATLVVRPSRTGRLKGLAKTTVAGVERVWVFMDALIATDEDGDELIDHHARGVVVGSLEQGRDFLDVCRELGLVVQNSISYVPFSNGECCYGEVYGVPFPRGVMTRESRNVSEFFKHELKMMRWDLPTRGQLISCMLEAADAK